MKDKSNDMSVCCNQNAQLSCDAGFINPQGKVQQQSKISPIYKKTQNMAK